MASKLYVGKLPYETTEEELRALFAPHGTVVSVAIIMDRNENPPTSKGFGFVEMENDAEAQAAIAALNGSEVGGRNIVVNVARPPEDRPAGGHGGNFQKRY